MQAHSCRNRINIANVVRQVCGGDRVVGASSILRVNTANVVKLVCGGDRGVGASSILRTVCDAMSSTCLSCGFGLTLDVLKLFVIAVREDGARIGSVLCVSIRLVPRRPMVLLWLMALSCRLQTQCKNMQRCLCQSQKMNMVGTELDH